MSLRYSSQLLALCVVIAPLVVPAPAPAQATNRRRVMSRRADGLPDRQGDCRTATPTPLLVPRCHGLGGRVRRAE